MQKPIIPWIGGKRRLAKHILPKIPAHTCYVEPFAGAAAIYFLKPASHVEVINDIDGDLVNLYRVVQHHLEEFCRQFKHALISRQAFLWEKSKKPETLTDIQRAARFFYLQKLSFGGLVRSRSFGTSKTTPAGLNLMRIEEDLSQAHIRLAQTVVENLDWRECIQRYDGPETFMFMDPPYLDTEGYSSEFGAHEYEALAETMRTMQGKCILSINDHPDIRRIFEGFECDEVSITYTTGVIHGKGAARRELLYRNFEPDAGLQPSLPEFRL